MRNSADLNGHRLSIRCFGVGQKKTKGSFCRRPDCKYLIRTNPIRYALVDWCRRRGLANISTD